MDNNYESLQRSTESIFNKSILLSVYEDLIIFVEDTDLGNVFELLFNRILDSNIKFENIKLAGGKRQVKDMYELYIEDPVVPSFFLVDLDYDDLLEKEKTEAENFLYLERYSIENYLLSEGIGIELLNARLKIGKQNCASRIEYLSWLSNIQQQLKFLNSIFISIQKLGLDITNTSRNAEVFLMDNSAVVDHDKINSYYEKVQKIAHEEGKYQDLNDLIDKYLNEQDRLYRDTWHIIPGKILFKAYYKYIQELLPKKKKQLYYDDDFYYTAANHCEIGPLEFIRQKINKYLENFHEQVS
ncbi:DUF4435 domain-containing protein [Rossellomorea sp. DA94]|uniref:DUF4435 domain-containing protein n=1 Tax=Rossellomorea sp. DA94 TaxID=3038653 RepID=UPI002446E7A0|nr:DUF4435 domain-containing protein [Rossellomorea sp. DA94]WGG44184.1 DUF4435 domain-containing protein [Rossellomorea sp. DA94]